MDDVVSRLGQLRAATAALLAGLEEQHWSDDDVRAPSLLPGWSRGHVLTHLARNADGVSRTLAGALRGEIVERYPDGSTGRNADIEDGAGRSISALLADVRDSADRLDRVLAAVADAGAWTEPTGERRTAADWLIRRWREVEIHRVDLAGDYTPRDWPAEFVQYLLDVVSETLGERAAGPVHVRVSDTDVVISNGDGAPTTIEAPGWAVAAWLIGREPTAPQLAGAPALAPWI